MRNQLLDQHCKHKMLKYLLLLIAVGAEEIMETNEENRNRLQREALYDDALEQFSDYKEKSKVNS